MNIAFAGFRHSHILDLYKIASEEKSVNIVGCFEENDSARIDAEKLGIDFTYENYSDVLNDENVQIVAIGDYYGIRGKRVIEALKAGKHVICDKPLCTSLSELDEIEKLTKEKNLKILIMLDLRYKPQIEKVRNLIRDGAIGKVNIATFTGQHCLNYGTRPSWYFEEGKHGGTINDISIHGIDLVRYITGKNLSEVTFAHTWNAFAKEEPNFPDCAQFIVKMDDMVLNADVSYAAPKFQGTLPTYWHFTFWGEDGMLTFNIENGDIKIYKENLETITCPDRKLDYLCDFIKEINGEEVQFVNTEDMLISQRAVLEIQKAADGKDK